MSPKKWSAQEAQEYKVWLTSSLDERKGRLVQIFDEPFGAEPSDHLGILGQKVANALLSAPFSEERDSGKRLTNAVYAIAADMVTLPR